jgi:DNA-binding transcriptional LysR family regulator
VTPPAISIQLKLLEDGVGSPLFHRDAGTPFVPTEIGAELQSMALDIEKLTAQTIARVAALQGGAIESVIFGVVSTAKYLAPYLVAAFARAHPEIKVTLAVGNRGDIVRGLERYEYDLAMMGRPPGDLRIESAPLADNPHVLIAPPDHRLAGKSGIQVEDLLGENFLAREQGSGTRILMERFLARIESERTFNIVEMGANETIKQSVMAGLGVAIISAHTCTSEIASGRLITLQVAGLPLVRQWFLVHRADRTPSMATKKFKAFVLDQGATLLPKI